MVSLVPISLDEVLRNTQLSADAKLAEQFGIIHTGPGCRSLLGTRQKNFLTSDYGCGMLYDDKGSQSKGIIRRCRGNSGNQD